MRFLIPGVAIVLVGCVEQYKYDLLRNDLEVSQKSVKALSSAVQSVKAERDDLRDQLEGEGAAQVEREEHTVDALEHVANALREISASNAKVAEAQLAQATAQEEQNDLMTQVKDAAMSWPGAALAAGGIYGGVQIRKRRKNGKAEENGS
jgi:uncharacterized protein YoxC